MKKFFMAVIALMMTISASAQFYIYYSDGTVAKVDSISMVAPAGTDTPDTPEEPEVTTDITVKAKMPAHWTNTITAWVWADGMDGQAVTPTKDGEWYVVTENTTSLNIIFRNGTYWNGDANQTEDITSITTNTCYQLAQEGSAKATYTVVDCESGTVEPDLEDTDNHHEYVDLGLSVKWATCNIGANSPEEYGDYFAFGEVKPKSDYTWSNYKWCESSTYTLTKYCTESNYGIVDNKTVLDPEDDAAVVNWGG